MPNPVQPSTTLSPTATWQSPNLSGPTDGANLYLCITALASGQTVSLRVVAFDAFGNAFYYGSARAALAATGQYLYCIKPGATTTGGAIPVDGLLSLPAPDSYAIQLVFGDTSGTKSVTFSLATGDKA